MQKRNELKKLVKEIKKCLEVYMLTRDPRALRSAEKDYDFYLREGGNKTLESLERTVQREYCLSHTW